MSRYCEKISQSSLQLGCCLECSQLKPQLQTVPRHLYKPHCCLRPQVFGPAPLQILWGKEKITNGGWVLPTAGGILQPEKQPPNTGRSEKNNCKKDTLRIIQLIDID